MRQSASVNMRGSLGKALVAASMIAASVGLSSTAHAGIVPMTQSELLNIAQAGFGGGTVNSVVADGANSVIVTGTLSAAQGTFTRFVPQDVDWQGQGTFNWSPYDAFQITVTPLTGNVGGAQLFVQTGSSFENFLTGPFTSVTLNNPTTLSYTLTGAPATNLTQQWGVQVFSGVANAGETASVRFTVVAVPEPASLSLLGAGALLVRRRRAV